MTLDASGVHRYAPICTMTNNEIIVARENGCTFPELARVSGKPEIEVRKIWATRRQNHQPNRHDDTVTTLADIQLPPPAETRAATINRLHREFGVSIRASVELAITCGQELAAQKEECGHGNWLKWVKLNLEFSEDTAQRYIRCYERRSEVANTEPTRYLTIEEIAKLPLPEPEPEPAAEAVLEPKKENPIVEKVREAWRQNPNASLREISKTTGCALSTAHNTRKKLFEAGEIPAVSRTPGAQPKPHAFKGLELRSSQGLVRIDNPPKGWHVIANAQVKEEPQSIVCTECWTFSRGGISFGGGTNGAIYECQCEGDNHRNAERVEEAK